MEGAKKVQEEHDLEAALIQAADAIDAETSVLRNLGDHHFRYLSCIPGEKRLSRGRLTYVDGGGSCKRFMVVTFLHTSRSHEGHEPIRIKSDSTNVICLPEGVTDVKIHFLVKGGRTVKKVDRSDPKQPWVKDETSGEYQTDEFDLDRGDGVDAVFLVRGSLTHSYVHKAWDFGRHPTIMPRSWEWWPSAEEEYVKLLPDIGSRTLHRTRYEQEPCGMGLGLASCGSCFGQDSTLLASVA